MASIGNADRPLSNDRYHLWPNGSEPPGYDAATNQTSVPPFRQNAQQPSTVITVRYYTSYRTIRQITVYSFKQVQQAPPVFMPPVLGLQNPNYDGPADFLVLVLVTTIACSVLNMTSLIFGTFALVMVIKVSTGLFRFIYPCVLYPTTLVLLLLMYLSSYAGSKQEGSLQLPERAKVRRGSCCAVLLQHHLDIGLGHRHHRFSGGCFLSARNIIV